MPNWRDGLVEAFPIPEDRRPGYRKKKKPRFETENATFTPGAATTADQTGGQTLAEALSSLAITNDDEHKTPIPSEPFPFFDLPAELRNRVYHYHLFSKREYRTVRRPDRARLSPLLVSKRMHSESSHILYSTTAFPVFPLQLFETPPTILDILAKYHSSITNLKLIVGPSWTAIPKSWKVTPRLARILKKLPAIQTLRVFAEFDPSHPTFAKYRVSKDFYTDFCGDLLADVLEVMPQLKYVEFDGNPGVDVNGPLVKRMREEAVEAGKEVRWGKEANWAHKVLQLLLTTETLDTDDSSEASVKLK